MRLLLQTGLYTTSAQETGEAYHQQIKKKKCPTT